MSEPAALGAIKQDPEDVSSKTDEATFTTLTEEGFPVGPSLKSPTPAEDTTILSDDETKTLTTLEPARKPTGGVAKKSFPGAVGATAVSQKLSNVNSNKLVSSRLVFCLPMIVHSFRNLPRTISARR